MPTATGTSNFGTLSFLDTLASNPSNQTVLQYGEDRLYQIFQDVIDAHNAVLQDLIDQLCERTTIRATRFGSYAKVKFQQRNEYSIPQAQKSAVTGDNLGFPLIGWQTGLQWTRKYFARKTVQEIAEEMQGVTDGDIDNIYGKIRKAIFTPTDYNFVDVEVDNYVIPVKAFFNADGMFIPPDQFGNTFDGNTHTHYLATDTLTAANVQALVDTVMEHVNTGTCVVYINRGNETAVRALTGFIPYNDARIIPANNTVQARETLTPNNVNNRAIGLLAGAEIWVKPWIPANYMFAFNPTVAKPLAYRVPENESGDLALEFTDEQYPLRAESFDRVFGIGVWRRQNGAVLYFGGSTYVTPTLLGL